VHQGEQKVLLMSSACTQPLTSMLRWVITPSNGAMTLLDTPLRRST
jgi:hypothetical protein